MASSFGELPVAVTSAEQRIKSVDTLMPSIHVHCVHSYQNKGVKNIHGYRINRNEEPVV